MVALFVPAIYKEKKNSSVFPKFTKYIDMFLLHVKTVCSEQWLFENCGLDDLHAAVFYTNTELHTYM